MPTPSQSSAAAAILEWLNGKTTGTEFRAKDVAQCLKLPLSDVSAGLRLLVEQGHLFKFHSGWSWPRPEPQAADKGLKGDGGPLTAPVPDDVPAAPPPVSTPTSTTPPGANVLAARILEALDQVANEGLVLSVAAITSAVREREPCVDEQAVQAALADLVQAGQVYVLRDANQLDAAVDDFLRVQQGRALRDRDDAFYGRAGKSVSWEPPRPDEALRPLDEAQRLVADAVFNLDLAQRELGSAAGAADVASARLLAARRAQRAARVLQAWTYDLLDPRRFDDEVKGLGEQVDHVLLACSGRQQLENLAFVDLMRMLQEIVDVAKATARDDIAKAEKMCAEAEGNKDPDLIEQTKEKLAEVKKKLADGGYHHDSVTGPLRHFGLLYPEYAKKLDPVAVQGAVEKWMDASDKIKFGGACELALSVRIFPKTEEIDPKSASRAWSRSHGGK